MDLKRQLSEERVKRMEATYRHAQLKPPRCNPWQYSNRRSSYPKDPSHPDYAGPDGSGCSRLCRAVCENDLARVRQLIDDEGANPFTRAGVNHNPLWIARNSGHWEVAEFIAARMQMIREECQRYERLTGKKLGLRSLRRRMEASQARTGQRSSAAP